MNANETPKIRPSIIGINVGIPAPTAKVPNLTPATIPPLYATIAETYFPTAAPILI